MIDDSITSDDMSTVDEYHEAAKDAIEYALTSGNSKLLRSLQIMTDFTQALGQIIDRENKG